jgi:hypothetical protein
MQLTETGYPKTKVGGLPQRGATTCDAGVRRLEITSTYFTGWRELMHIGRMGRFSSVLVVVLLAACGDNLVGDEGGAGRGPAGEVDPNGNATDVPRYVPSVCSVQTWATNVTGDAGMNVSVAPNSNGAAVLATPRIGGMLTGFVLDTRMNMISVNKVAIDGAFTQVVASYVGERLVSTAVQDGAVFMHLLDADISNPQLAAKVPGKYIADPALYKTQADLVMPVARDDGLWLHRFGASLEPLESKLVVASSPARSLTAAQLGVAMLTAWSTDTACHIMLTSTFSKGLTATVPSACADPRISVNQKNGDAVLVFDSSEGVQLMTVQPSQLSSEARLLRPGTAAPRTLFDGTSFWISYLDPRGDILVGFLDGNGQLITMSLAGPKPEAGAYELVMVDGSPWIFSLGTEGYSAYRMCVETQW